MAARRDRNYGKEVIGTMMWLALIAYLFWGDGFPGCRQDSGTVPLQPLQDVERENAEIGENQFSYEFGAAG